MKITETRLPGVIVIENRVFRDHRGYFLETWNAARAAEVGLPDWFAQDNLSVSTRGVLRGLHYQEPGAQGKLVTALRGTIRDVAVDIRVGSPDFGRWVAVDLVAEEGRQIYVPEGFAHGFAVLSDEAVVHYKATAPYAPASEGSIRWDDPDLAIDWGVTSPIQAVKDRDAPRLREVPADRLPKYPGGAGPG